MTEGPRPQSWWQTLPGILTAVATIITATAGLIAALHQAGVLSGENNGSSSNHDSTTSHNAVVTVAARKAWQDTGVVVPENTRVTIKVREGAWTRWDGALKYNHGEGDCRYCDPADPDEECSEILPGFLGGGLVARIANRQFGVGNEISIINQQQGKLELRINDDDKGLHDNNGSLEVGVVVEDVKISTFEQYYLNIDAKLGLQTTDIDILHGDTITVEVLNGRWTHIREAIRYNSGYGKCPDENSDTDQMYYKPFFDDLFPGSLVARIGDQVFGIGQKSSITAQQSGELIIGINEADAALYDNDGTLRVRVTVER